MIVFTCDSEVTFDEGTLSSSERNMYEKKKNSLVEYRYDSISTLLFELQMRNKIIQSSWALSTSGVFFASFKKSKCNELYWHLTEHGRFQLKNNVSPQDAIRDIFRNGNLYAFECATAIVIVLYRAILESIDPNHFDRLFSDLLLFDWHYNRKLHLIDQTNRQEAIAGDVLYFENPEFSPLLPWWKGENAILMEDGFYYGHGHGMGIATAEDIIYVLNKYRDPGSTKSAFLTDCFVYLDFSYFSQFQSSTLEQPILAKIGSWTFVR
ncbi:protein-glutamine gamma-glutamyltransferase [Paenibacillus sp. N3.4]|uniref:protein-glutamine gamma-glutamyltransferase n=1 Tax=Paenibacillus sp. N3.4 TaxID=2603222 RepID=UPI0011CBC488|nr:protein-glutamine gamma-glutamyltransferase [Paenibacillus sp. N3.4]TXK72429.1 protein-glutamine gamma-glutamyltransferase [Paenibacillus sp. N3.4]